MTMCDVDPQEEEVTTEVPAPCPVSRRVAYASLILGILGLMFAPILCGWVPAFFGLRLGRKHLREAPSGKRIAKLGICLSVIAVLLPIIPLVAFVNQFLPGLHHVRFVQIPNPLQPGATARMSFDSCGRSTVDPIAALQSWVGIPAPDIEWQDAGQNVHHLSDFKGRKVLLAFVHTGNMGGGLDIPNRLYTEFKDVPFVGLLDWDADALGNVMGMNAHFPLNAVSVSTAQEPYFLIEAFPTIFVMDRTGVIQGIFNDKSPYESIVQLASGPDYVGEVKTPPQPVSRQPESAPVQWIMEKAWESDVDAMHKVTVCDWNGDSQDEMVGHFMSEYTFCDGNGKAFQDVEIEKPFGFQTFAVGRADKEVRIAYMVSEKDVITVVDMKGESKWSQDSKPMLSPKLFWVDLDGNGMEYLVASDRMSHAAIYASDGTLRKKWDKENEGGVFSIDFPSMNLVWSSARGDYFESLLPSHGTIGPGPLLAVNWNSFLWFSPALEASATTRLQVPPGQFIVYDITGKGQVEMGLINTGAFTGPRRSFLSVLNKEGRPLWRTLMADSFSDISDRVAAGDFDGDGTKEWVLFGVSGLLLISADGKVLCEKPLAELNEKRRTPGHTAPKKVYEEQLRVLSRPGKGDLLLLPTGENWIAYGFKH